MPKNSYHHGALKPAIIDTALAMIADGGIESVQLRQLAEKLGVAHPALYRHFPDRRALLRASLAHAYQQLHQQLLARQQQNQLSTHDILMIYGDYAFANPRLFLAMAGEPIGHGEKDDPLEQAMERCFQLLLSAVNEERLAPSGQYGAYSGTDAMALFFWSATQGLLVQILHGRIDLQSPDRGPYLSSCLSRLLQA